MKKLATSLALLTLTGCASIAPQPIDANAFLAPPAPSAPPPMGTTRPVAPPPPEQVTGASTQPIIEPTLAQIIEKGPTNTTTAPVTQPVTVEKSETSGQYLTLGGVMCEVNGTPIFGNKVVELAELDLAAKARTMSEPEFKKYATDIVAKTLGYLIRDELMFAAAQKELGQDEQRMVELATTQWRQQQITDAGGSVELARRQALADGTTFEERLERRYRLFMREFYYRKKFYPRIQISATDMREYYRTHKDADFTDREAARFRVIKITAAAMGGRDKAQAKIHELHDRIKSGVEDFASVAGAINHDPRLMKKAGDEGLVDRHAYSNEKLEEAVWALQPGQVTEVMEIGTGNFYIARLEEKKVGRVRQFEDPGVQSEIEKKMHDAQLTQLNAQTEASLRKQAVVSPDPPTLDPAMEIVWQKYPRWKAN